MGFSFINGLKWKDFRNSCSVSIFSEIWGVHRLKLEHGTRGQVLRDPNWKLPWYLTKNIKQKQYYNKFNKDFKNGPHQKKNV